jgi:hypothetical protein
VLPHADTCPVAPEAASQLGWSPVLTRVLRLWWLPPCWGGLQRCHMSCGIGPCLPAGVGSDAATCHAAPDPASLLEWAPVLPCVLDPGPCLPAGVSSGATTCPRPRTLPPCWGGLQCRHVSCGPGPCLPARGGSGAPMCLAAPDPASQLGWAPVSPRVLQPWTLPPCWGRLRRRHVSTVAMGCGP